METVIDKLFPKLGKDLKQKMLDELKDWPPEPVDELAAQGGKDTLTKASTNSLANELVK